MDICVLHFLANELLKYWWSQDKVLNNMFTKHISNLFPMPAAGGDGGGGGPIPHRVGDPP